MPKYAQYFLLLMVLIVPTGCSTVKGATSGASSDLDQGAHNLSDPDRNGWHALQKADAWQQEHLW